MNALDRVIAAVSPQTAVKRAAARRKLDILDSGYGNYGRITYEEIACGLAVWRRVRKGRYSGQFIDPAATLPRPLHGRSVGDGALKTCRTNVIGSGLRLKSQIDYEALGMDEEAARDLERKIEREFSLWADSTACDLERLDNFYELQQLAFLNWLMSGDVIATLPVTKRANMPYDLRICLIEADRLSNPNGIVDPHIIGGVETNDAGEVVAYHMRRGVPFLAPVIEALKQLWAIYRRELVAAVVSGMFTVFIEKESASSDGGFGEIIPEDAQVDAGDDSTIELAPGAIVDLNEGEKHTT